MSEYPSPYSFGEQESGSSYAPVRPVPAPPAVSETHLVISWVVTAITLLYMLPWAIAATRRTRMATPIALVTFFTGWTGLGWLGSLIWACLAPIDPTPGIHPHPGYGYGPSPAPTASADRYAASPYATTPQLPAAPGAGFPAYPATPNSWQQPGAPLTAAQPAQPPTERYPTDEFPTERY